LGKDGLFPHKTHTIPSVFPAWSQEPGRYTEECPNLTIPGSFARGQWIGIEEDTIKTAWQKKAGYLTSDMMRCDEMS